MPRTAPGRATAFTSSAAAMTSIRCGCIPAATCGRLLTLKKGYFSGGKELGKGAHVVSAYVPINEGDSGGPLVNERGEVVGVAAAVAWEAHGAGLFIDVSEVRALADVHLSPSISATPPPAGPSPGGATCTVRVCIRWRWSGPTATSARPAGLLDRSRHLLADHGGGGRQARDGGRDVSRSTATAGSCPRPPPTATNPACCREKGLLTTGTVLATDARRNLALLEVGTVPRRGRGAIRRGNPGARRFAACAGQPQSSRRAVGLHGRQRAAARSNLTSARRWTAPTRRCWWCRRR